MADLPIRRIRSAANTNSDGFGPIRPSVGFSPIRPPVGFTPIRPPPGFRNIGPQQGIGSIIPPVGSAANLSTSFPVAMGWLPDVPDHRDRTLDDDVVVKKMKIKGKLFDNTLKLDSKVDLADPNLGLLPPIQDQGTLESCTAHAVVAMLEYLQRFADHDQDVTAVDLSRLFLYKATRDYEGVNGDAGAYLRDTLKAAGLFGVPPEDRFPYIADNVDVEPPAFLYAYAANFKALNYIRLDSDKDPKITLENTKRVLMHRLPVAFGFTVYSNLTTAADIPLPSRQDKPLGGHAVLAVGYDDNRVVKGAKETKGAIKIRNSWGPQWGDQGYGWLPYEYITGIKGISGSSSSVACDFWTCFKFTWPMDNPQDNSQSPTNKK